MKKSQSITAFTAGEKPVATHQDHPELYNYGTLLLEDHAGNLRKPDEASPFFDVEGMQGPYAVDISRASNGIECTVQDAAGEKTTIVLQSNKWLPIIQDRMDMLAQYDAAKQSSNPAAIEAMEAPRKTQHNAFATDLQSVLAEGKFGTPKITMDHETARNLFAVMAEWVGERVPKEMALGDPANRIDEIHADTDGLDAEAARKVADCIYDAQDQTSGNKGWFHVPAMKGPYSLTVQGVENGIGLTVRNDSGAETTVTLPLRPWRTMIAERGQRVTDYYQALTGHADADTMDAKDKARRAQHNAAAMALQKACLGQVSMDFETARCLFDVIATAMEENISQGMGREGFRRQ